MSEEEETLEKKLEKIEEETRELEEELEKPKPAKQKNPNRVRAGHKLAAIGQKAKEEKMRKKVEDEMIKPKTWVSIGIIIGGTCVGGLWLGVPLLGKKKETPKEVFVERKEEPKPTNKYFG